MIQQGDILRCKDGNVSFKYRDARTGKMGVRTLGGANFLRLVLQNVLPKGLRRARNFGSLHPTARGRFACGEPMHVVHRRVAALQSEDRPNANLRASTCPTSPTGARSITEPVAPGLSNRANAASSASRFGARRYAGPTRRWRTSSTESRS